MLRSCVRASIGQTLERSVPRVVLVPARAQRGPSRSIVCGASARTCSNPVPQLTLSAVRSVTPSPRLPPTHSASRFRPAARAFAGAAPTASANGTIDFLLADIGEGIAEVALLEWYVKPGDRIVQFQEVCKVESDKATVPISSRYDGVVKEIKYKAGDMAIVGKPLLTIQLDGPVDVPAGQTQPQPQAQAQTAVKPAPGAPAPGTGSEKVLASPAVRRIARENNVNLADVPATGPKSHVTKQDILAFIESGGVTAPAAQAQAQAQPAGAGPVPSRSALVQDTVVPLTGVQRKMVQTMIASSNVPQLGLTDEIQLDDLVRLRAQLKPLMEKQGIKLSYLPFIIKATSLALRQYPMLNAHVNADCTQVTHRGSHNIGLAMDTPRGLIVPNIKNVQDLSIVDIARELARLADLGSKGSLGRDELTGGTFTLSNIGSIAGTVTKPLLVVPEVMIGGLGKFQTLPRFDSKGQVYPSQIMMVSWSADHRVVDGATVARFSNLWKNYLERPSAMLMDMK